MKNVKFHGGLVVTFVISYILIKFIDNYSFFLGIITNILSLLTPFIIGMILAYILSPLVDLMEKKLKIRRWITILIIYGVTLSAAIIFIIMIVPSITSSIVEIINQIPQYSQDVEMWVLDVTTQISGVASSIDSSAIVKIQDSLLSIIPHLSDFAKIALDCVLSTTVSITTLILNIVFGIIISVYMISDKENIICFVKKVIFILLKREKADLVFDVCRTFNSSVGTYIVAKLIDSFFVGLVSFIGISLIGSKYALLLGIICGITNMIPFFGPFIGMVPVFLINIFYAPSVAMWSLVFLIILQQIEGNFIEPKFVGGQLGLTPLLTLLAVTIGGGLFGIVGMILSVPVMGVIKIYVDKVVEKYQYRGLQ